MQLFYVPDKAHDDEFSLSEDESFHCVRVLRMKEGDKIHLTDGKGNLYEGILTIADTKCCRCRVVRCVENYGRRNFSIHMAIAPTKNSDRLEWFLEKATEIGVDTITLILCEHSERKIVKQERLEKVITAAMKQSLKTYRPILHPLTPFSDFVVNCFAEVKTIAVCEGERKTLSELSLKNKETLLMIGPEGDFSPEEIRLAVKQGFIPVSLGEARLRTETAGVVGCHSIHLLNAI